MSEIISKFTSTMEEFCEVSRWINQCISNSKPLEITDLTMINNKIDALYLIAENYDKSFRTNIVNFPSDLILRVENNASILWNSIAIALKVENNQENLKTFVRCDLFATILLSIHEAIDTGITKKLRVFKCYIIILKQITKFSNSDAWLQLLKETTFLLEKWFQIIENAFSNTSETPFTEGETLEFKQLKFEYFLLNMQLTIRNGNFETAKLYESQTDIPNNIDKLDPPLLLELCQIIYNSTVDLKELKSVKCTKPGHITQQFTDSDHLEVIKFIIYFLKKALEYLSLDVKGLKGNLEYSNIRYNILLFLTDSFINFYEQLDSNIEDCQFYLNMLQNEYPKNTEPFQLAIKLCKKKVSQNQEVNIKEILMGLITSVDIYIHLDTILGCISDFAELSTSDAVIILDYLLNNKVDFDSNSDIAEKIILSRYYLTVQSKTLTIQEIISSIIKFSELIKRLIVHNFSKHIAASIITLLWNAGKKFEKEEMFNESVEFYKLCLIPLISEKYNDKIKLKRALLSAYIKSNDYKMAHNLFNEFSNEEQMNPLNQFYMLRLTFLEKNIDDTLKHLKLIADSNFDKTIDILLLAVVEIKSNSQLLLEGVNLLFQILDDKQLNDKKLSEYSIPTLAVIRYSIQLILKTHDELDLKDFLKKYSSTILSLLEKGFEFANRICIIKKIPKINVENNATLETVSVSDIEWFSSTSYNISVKGLTEPLCAQPFVKLSKKFFSLVPTNEFSFPKSFHYWFWKTRTDILEIVIEKDLIDMENIAAWKSLYQKSDFLLQNVIEKKNSTEFIEENTDLEKNQIKECINDATKVNIEILIYLKEKLKINALLEHNEISSNFEIYSYIESLLLSKNFKSEILGCDILLKLFQKNVFNTEVNCVTLCFWLRVLLEWSIRNNYSIPIDIIRCIQTRIKNNTTSSAEDINYISEELEVIVTLCWNKGINFIIEEQKSLGTDWCLSAKDCAYLVTDNLGKHFEDLWKSLNDSAKIND
ncbi:hypothetical protein TBLA_0J01300 [Henningerozyma blattae CBS 6284]|uniref:Protein ZIP4 homolog n=1 Tax=Henningerozyma blattae (strain ATCC 34711 / CBS 6284 / DSM 70876 / NBRC 10599 / NRRL Y-10934 / UCD 77-7) TaxID=1071380 RepID=I2H9S4_HENB6|nr:hypothetical protein TBLA_0J01300 [Tetrapisispora blattae CBS 6284]CCH63126.1 hypothetical protein TBLA_0J01300 [Tetrapisispora blattae CBS 6284]